MKLLSNGLMAIVVGGTLLTACRPGTPVVDPAAHAGGTDGTIAGNVTTGDKMPLPDRVVRAISDATRQAYEARTNQTGGYTIKVPPGNYHLELVLREGERLLKEPVSTRINSSDLDPGRDFVLATALVREH
jgi:hypothetical protein